MGPRRGYVHEEETKTSVPAAVRGDSRNGHDKTAPQSVPVRRRRTAEKQVLFRVDAELLTQLDHRLLASPYRTRNAWFKATVEEFLTRAR